MQRCSAKHFFLALLLSIVQIGPSVIFIPVTLWSWTILDTIPAIIFTCYMVPLGLLDNVLRPIVMSRGLPIPMPVFFVGMVGGIVAYGISGLFLGPVVISVFWTLLVAWLREDDVPSQHPSSNLPAGGSDITSSDTH